MWLDASINDLFQLSINAKDIDFIGISYLILSFVQCGTCDGFPYLYDGICGQECPKGT